MVVAEAALLKAQGKVADIARKVRRESALIGMREILTLYAGS
jgi:hypothetical protein